MHVWGAAILARVAVQCSFEEEMWTLTLLAAIVVRRASAVHEDWDTASRHR